MNRLKFKDRKLILTKDPKISNTEFKYGTLLDIDLL